jgi:hypothetical protein
MRLAAMVCDGTSPILNSRRHRPSPDLPSLHVYLDGEDLQWLDALLPGAVVDQL